ncbi:rhodanese-like domain-containing protein [uncultured Desulfobulbus sp.]|uniref:rhodanese-like domain-containing protein n=1 Tax=uncultured Desulfobulbus sp. TaxID=239745 RepID=UPI0029C89E83|nr:rhodanese-like domain-containing protein [uncultured Desulfobulbus sp.]
MPEPSNFCCPPAKPGVYLTEIKTTELQKIINDKAPLFLVDSRPLIRFNQSHLPDAHSVPVPMLEEKQTEVLPKNKELPLVFYCGGPT